jgi:thiol-disulfide isomerase/thioredoxin
MAIALSWALASGQEPRNVITGEVEGLEIGDRVILFIESVSGRTWPATDSTVVSKAGEFTLETRATGGRVRLARFKAGEALDDSDEIQYCYPFLEGYAELRLTGDAAWWSYLKTSGGLYDHPDMRDINCVHDSAMAIQQEGEALLARAREKGGAKLKARANKLFRQSNHVFQGQFALLKVFREKHPEMAYSAYLLTSDFALMRDVDKCEEAFNALAPEARESRAGQQISYFIASSRGSRSGVLAPDFTRTDADGGEVTLSAFRGKHVLIDFWGSWCDPCRQSNPLLVKLHAALQSKGVAIEFIGVACDEPDDREWLEAIKKDKLAWTQVNDDHPGTPTSIGEMYAVQGFPTCVLISPEGKILYKDFTHLALPKIKKMFKL